MALGTKCVRPGLFVRNGSIGSAGVLLRSQSTVKHPNSLLGMLPSAMVGVATRLAMSEINTNLDSPASRRAQS